MDLCAFEEKRCENQKNSDISSRNNGARKQMFQYFKTATKAKEVKKYELPAGNNGSKKYQISCWNSSLSLTTATDNQRCRFTYK